MSTNNAIEGVDLDTIRQEAGVSTRNAINLLYQALNAEIIERRKAVRRAQNLLAPKVLSLAPTVNQNNLDLEGSSIVLFTGATAVSITGFRAPSTNESRIVIAQVIGAGTITISHASGSSDAENRVRNAALANLAIATDKTAMYLYLNSLWRQFSLA